LYEVGPCSSWKEILKLHFETDIG